MIRIEQVLGKESEEVATIYNNIAMALSDLNRFQEAMPYLQDSLRIRTKILGANHDLALKTQQRLTLLEQKLSSTLGK